MRRHYQDTEVKRAIFNYMSRRRKKHYNSECSFQVMLNQDVQRCGFVLGHISCPHYFQGSTLGHSMCIPMRIKGLA